MSVGLIVAIVGNILFAIAIIAAFFIGFWRGTKRSLIQLGMNIPMIICAIFTTAPITSAILNIKVSATESLSDKVLSLILQVFPDLQNFMDSSEAGSSFVKSLPAFIAGTVVFIVLLCLFSLVGYIIAKIIERFTLKSRKKEKAEGIKRNRWVGGAIGAVKGFALSLLIFAPITGLIGLLSDMQDPNNSAYTTSASSEKQSAIGELVTESLPAQVTEALSTYENKTAFGIIGGLFGWDNWIFDTVTKVKVEGKSIKMRENILEASYTYNTIADMQKLIQNPNGENLKDNIDWDKLDSIVYEFIDSGLFQGVVSNIFADITKNVENIDLLSGLPTEFKLALKKIGEDLNGKVPAEYLTHDIKLIYQTISNIGRDGILDEILTKNTATENKITGVLSETHKEALLKAIGNIFDLNMLKAGHEPIFDYVMKTIENSLGTSLNEPDTNINDWDQLKLDFQNIVSNAISMFNSVDFFSITADPISVLNLETADIDNLVTYGGLVLDTIDNLELFQCTEAGHTEETVLDKILIKYDFGNIKDVKEPVDSAEYGEDGITTYTEVLNFVSKALKTACSFELYDTIKAEGSDITSYLLQIAKILKNDSSATATSTKLEKVLLPLYQITTLKTKVIDEVLLTSLGSDFIDFSKLEVGSGESYNYTESYSNWENDLANLTKVLIALYENSITVSEVEKTLLEIAIDGDMNQLIKAIDNDLVDSLIPPLLHTKSLDAIKTTLFQKIAEGINTYTGETTSFTLSDSTFEGSSDQTTITCTILKDILNLAGEDGDITSEITLSDVNKAKPLLKDLQTNAIANGIYKQFYLDIYDKFISDYSDLSTILGDKTALTIDYDDLFDLVNAINDESDIFAVAIKDLISSYTDDKMLEVLGTLAGKFTVKKTLGIDAIDLKSITATPTGKHFANGDTAIRYIPSNNSFLVVASILTNTYVVEVSRTGLGTDYSVDISTGAITVTKTTGISVKDVFTGSSLTIPAGISGKIFDYTNYLIVTSNSNIYAIDTTTYTQETDYTIETANETKVNELIALIDVFNYSVEITDSSKKAIAENKINDLPIEEQTKNNLKSLIGLSTAGA